MAATLMRPGPRPTDPSQWSQLMARAQDGDAAAYGLLLRTVTPYLRAIASRAHRNAADAEDSLQDILLTLHQMRHTYDPARPFKPWLAGIAQHRIADRLRHRLRRSAREVSLDFEHEALASVPAAQTGMDHRALHAALGSLPEGQRQAVLLLKLQELSLREAAASSGQSAGALKVAVHRAIKALRALLLKGDDR